MSTRRRRRRACRVALFLACLALADVAAAATPIIRGGREAQLLALLSPIRDGGPITDHVALEGVRVAPDRVVLLLRAADGATAQAELLPLEPGGPRSFAFRAPPDLHARFEAAIERLRSVLKANDRGDFFTRPPDFAPLPAPSTAAAVWSGRRPGTPSIPPTWDPPPAADPLWDHGQAWLAALLWLVLLGVVITRAVEPAGPLHRVRGVPPQAGVVLLALVMWLAWHVRSGTGMVPLHANQHAFEDIAVALGLPEAAHAVARRVQGYGASWLVAQRALVATIVPRTHDGLATASALLGTLAVGWTIAAARAFGAAWLSSLVAGVAMACAPIAARVGSSESELAVAQALVACALWLTARARVDKPPRGVGLVIALLASGHVVGAPLAVAVALLVAGLWRGDRPSRLRLLGRLLGIAAAMAALSWWGHDGGGPDPHSGADAGLSALVRERLGGTESLLPVPGAPWQFWLWTLPAYVPWPLHVLAAIGGWHAWSRWRTGAWRPDAGLRAALSLLGVVGVIAAGLLVAACVSDGLRYQAVLAPIWILLAARAGRRAPAAGAAATSVSMPRGALAGALAVVAFVAGVGTLIAARQLYLQPPARDAMAQGYLALRETPLARGGAVYLVTPDRTEGRRAIVFEAPVGRWHDDSPRVVGVGADALRAACVSGQPLALDRVRVWSPPACGMRLARRREAQRPEDAAQGIDGPAAACQKLARALATDGTRREGEVTPLPSPPGRAIPGEFHRPAVTPLRWAIAGPDCAAFASSTMGPPPPGAAGSDAPQR